MLVLFSEVVETILRSQENLVTKLRRLQLFFCVECESSELLLFVLLGQTKQSGGFRHMPLTKRQTDRKTVILQENCENLSAEIGQDLRDLMTYCHRVFCLYSQVG